MSAVLTWLRRSVGLSLLLMMLGVPPVAQADASLIHQVRTGETWESIADLYYGDATKAAALRSENGIAKDVTLIAGMRVSIPTVTFHLTEEGDTWDELASRYYRVPERAFVLVEANGGKPNLPPDAGAELIIPYPIRHVTEQGESLLDVSRTYYSGAAAAGNQRLRRFNQIPGRQRPTRGQVLLVPLTDLQLSEQGRKFAEEEGFVSAATGDKREKQQQVAEELPTLREHVKRGRYVAAVAMANELLGMGDLSGNQLVTIQRELGTSLVALGEEQMAVDAFAAAVRVQPDMDLDMARTSPKVMKVFRQGQAQAKKAAAEVRTPVVETGPAPRAKAP